MGKNCVRSKDYNYSYIIGKIDYVSVLGNILSIIRQAVLSHCACQPTYYGLHLIYMG